MKNFKINKKTFTKNSKVYFIADIAANHDGKIERAKKLIYQAAEAGANAAKFQNFKAETIVSDFGYKNLDKKKLSHQSKWKKSVFQVYKEAALPLAWTDTLKKTCEKAGIDYFTAPYDLEMIDYLNKFVCAWKVGSGDVTWHENVLKMAKTKKPILIATGASNFIEVRKLLNAVLKINKKVVLMQCNTNYTADSKNLHYINLNVLKKFKESFPSLFLGLSDHTFGHETVLGAVALGAKFVEKHFTDDNSREGPDHKFSMNPKTWKEMIVASRNLENSMGDGIKKIEKNEKESVIVQRRSIRASRNLKKGTIIKKKDLVFLRPCPKNSLDPYMLNQIIGKRTKKNITFHEVLNLKNIG